MTSVIVVTYNGLKWLDKCIGHINKDLYTIIVIDNSSTDGTQEYIKKNYSYIDFIQAPENLGFGKANNIGIKKAYDSVADYVFLLNQDAWVEKDTIEKLIQVAEKSPEFGIISPMHINGAGSALDINFSNYISPKNCPDLYSDLYMKKVKESVYETTFVNAAAWLISRKCIETVGGFNPLFFLYGEDDNYIQRVKFHGLKIGVCPYAIIFHDRANRQKINNSKTEGSDFKRNLLLKYCDPREPNKIIIERSWLIKKMIKSLSRFRIKEFIDLQKQNLIISELTESVNKAQETSKKPGLTFLT